MEKVGLLLLPKLSHCVGSRVLANIDEFDLFTNSITKESHDVKITELSSYVVLVY